MDVKSRPYNHAADFEKVSRLLKESYSHDRPRTWLQPRWEYMHAHPMISAVALELIAVYEDRGEIVGIVHPENRMSEIYFQRRSGYDDLLPAMLDHTVGIIGGHVASSGGGVIGVYINEFDTALRSAAADRGFEMAGSGESYSKLPMNTALPSMPVPPGFRIRSLFEENDHRKINRCLWRGFDHEGEPPPREADLPGLAQGAPNFRKELAIVAVNQQQDYVAYASSWLVPENRIAYLEPVATDPDYRRLGLGGAVVLESLRRAQSQGAIVGWVGSNLDFYRSLGFEQAFLRHLWVKQLD